MTAIDARKPLPSATPPSAASARARKARFGDALLRWLARGSALTVIGMVVVLLAVLLYTSWPAIINFGPGFLVSSEWRANELEVPKTGPDGKILIVDGETVMETILPSFGALPVIYGTVVSSIIALVFAVPLSIGAALFIVRVAPRLKIAGPVSFLIEFLASVPSIAFGLWGLFVVAPLIGRNMLCGGLILGIMILPIITAVSRDVLKSVPRGQIEGSLALGASWWQSCWGMIRYAKSGLFGAMILGLARAAGETMAVAMVIGNNNQIKLSLFEPAQTMSSLLANEFAEATGEMHAGSLLYVAMILLVMSLMFNVLARGLIVGHESRNAEN